MYFCQLHVLRDTPITMRLFIALDLDDSIRSRLKHFVDDLSTFAPDVRWVAEESFHITLKFTGQSTPEQAAEIKTALALIKSPAVSLEIRSYGFFPRPAAPRVFWAGVHADEILRRLAASIDKAMANIGTIAERAPYHPHITLARAGSAASRGDLKDRPPDPFRRLQEKLSSMPVPDFGSMTAREFFLYESRLSPEGSIYSKLARFPIGE
jgi:RNA 2',3'-cyclic 3'-phosphodiesterase